MGKSLGAGGGEEGGGPWRGRGSWESGDLGPGKGSRLALAGCRERRGQVAARRWEWRGSLGMLGRGS